MKCSQLRPGDVSRDTRFFKNEVMVLDLLFVVEAFFMEGIAIDVVDAVDCGW